MNLSRSFRMNLTMALLIVLSGACSSAQRAQVHDVLNGVHAVCEAADPGVHLLLTQTEAPDASVPADATTDATSER